MDREGDSSCKVEATISLAFTDNPRLMKRTQRRSRRPYKGSCFKVPGSGSSCMDENCRLGEDGENMETEKMRIIDVQRICYCEWIQPKEGWVKVNSDASVTKKGVGCGYIFRDHKGDVVLGEAKKLQKMSILEAEFVAIYLACEKAREMKHLTVWIESDCLSAVMFINGVYHWSWEYSDLVRNIQNTLSSFDSWRMTHIWREGNKGADRLAKMGASGKEIRFDKDCIPSTVLRLVEDDRQGKKYIRVKRMR